MSLATVDEVSVWFGARAVLDEVSFAVQPGERIGLVGPNGAGKSTLLRLLAREREADAGDLGFARGVRVGYLPQDILELPAGTLVESVRGIARASAPELEASDFDERHPRHRAEELLSGLGFPAARFERPVGELSGGWKMRVALAGLLLIDPELLLLDEPTNHLDLPSLAWFDGFLRRSPHALVLVSHDRDFLNRQIDRVLAFEPEGLRAYTGNYDSYRAQREEEEENLALRAARQAAERAVTMQFIERFRYKATKARQAQSRLKQLEKQETIEVRGSAKKVRFRFPEVTRSGREVVRIEGLGKAFGDNVVYRGLGATVERGDRVAIIGVNGAGKSTLLRMIAGELTPDAGSIALGHNVTVAYYAQHHTDTLERERTVLDEISALIPSESPTFVRGVLGAFLFAGDDVDKKIAVLSGGERARVALARLLVLPSNLMLMDEPTNHLDVASAERLVEALREYDGTLIFVSHNKSFVNQLATKVWEVQDGALSAWAGNLDDYLYHLAELGQSLGGSVQPPAPRLRAVENDRERRQREARERESRAARTRPLESQVRALEAEIAALEAELPGLEAELADPALYQDFTRAQPVLDRARDAKARLELALAEWETASEALARAQQD